MVGIEGKLNHSVGQLSDGPFANSAVEIKRKRIEIEDLEELGQPPDIKELVLTQTAFGEYDAR